MAIEIVDFPIENGGSFHSYVSHYQRVNMGNAPGHSSLENEIHGIMGFLGALFADSPTCMNVI